MFFMFEEICASFKPYPIAKKKKKKRKKSKVIEIFIYLLTCIIVNFV